MIDHTADFRSRLLECMDVSDSEALTRSLNGLKQGIKDWALINDPIPYTKRPNGQNGMTVRTFIALEATSHCLVPL